MSHLTASIFMKFLFFSEHKKDSIESNETQRNVIKKKNMDELSIHGHSLYIQPVAEKLSLEADTALG